jgi:Lon protease-like protein
VGLLDRLAGRARREMPIFPLGTVLFPGALLPLRIFEVRYMDMARACLRDNSHFGICLIREGAEVGAPAVPENVGCAARIAECDVEELGILKARVEGLGRFRIVSSEVTKQGLIVGQVEDIAAEDASPDAEGLAECALFLGKAITGIGEERFAQPFRYDDASWVSFRLAEILPLRMEAKQAMLELTDPAARLAVIHKFLKQQKLI